MYLTAHLINQHTFLKQHGFTPFFLFDRKSITSMFQKYYLDLEFYNYEKLMVLAIVEVKNYQFVQQKNQKTQLTF